MKYLITGAIVVASLVACGKKNSDASMLASASMQPGEFKLYDEPNATPDPDCDIHTALSLLNTASGPVARLENRVSGFCEIMISPSKREYKLEVSTDSCGALQYSGEIDEVNSIEITDNRKNVCEMVILAPIVVSEIFGDHRLEFFSLPAAQSTPSHPRKFQCGNVGGTEEHVIMIDLNKNIAGFFDNDNTALVPLLRTLSLESNPPQTLHLFEGPDSGGGTGEILSISFNETKMEGTVTFDAKGSRPVTKKAFDKCLPSEDFDMRE